MRHGGNTVSVLYCGCYGHCARTLAHMHASMTAVGLLLENILRMMRGDIYIGGMEFLQTVDTRHVRASRMT